MRIKPFRNMHPGPQTLNGITKIIPSSSKAYLFCMRIECALLLALSVVWTARRVSRRS